MTSVTPNGAGGPDQDGEGPMDGDGVVRGVVPMIALMIALAVGLWRASWMWTWAEGTEREPGRRTAAFGAQGYIPV